jgi:hypothetical protein
MVQKLMEGFEKLNDAVSIYRPPTSNGHTKTAPDASDTPSLVVFCSWMGAAPKHISKYTRGYCNLFPNAEILLIESTVKGMFFGVDQKPAIDFLKTYTATNFSGNAIIHISSNGGATNATSLGLAIKHKNISLKFTNMIIDCCPGKGELDSATHAMSFALPKQPIINFIGWYMIYAFTASYVFFINATGSEDVISWIRRVMNDGGVYSSSTKRLYLYSKKDALVNWKHVSEHAEAARNRGYGVREEVFEKAPHCALVNEDAERYWDAIKEEVSEGE